jgi:hypothetical protein
MPKLGMELTDDMIEQRGLVVAFPSVSGSGELLFEPGATIEVAREQGVIMHLIGLP